MRTIDKLRDMKLINNRNNNHKHKFKTPKKSLINNKTKALLL